MDFAMRGRVTLSLSFAPLSLDFWGTTLLMKAAKPKYALSKVSHCEVLRANEYEGESNKKKKKTTRYSAKGMSNAVTTVPDLKWKMDARVCGVSIGALVESSA